MKHGDQLFIYNEFNIKDPGTWMSFMIRFALSLDNYNLGDAPVRHNHTANVVEINGVLWVFEAGWNKQKLRAEVKRTKAVEWIAARKAETYEVATPIFEYDPDLYRLRAIQLLTVSYGFKDVLISMPIHLLFRKTIWIGGKGLKTVFCSKFSAFLYDMWGFYKIDPEELKNKFIKQ